MSKKIVQMSKKNSSNEQIKKFKFEPKNKVQIRKNLFFYFSVN